ncbi:M23 family metallopeptidase [Altererythrobacter sp.]|uniref:M23 family metallopeptidase n=1 Tax=Altererythrobacter sp. TaxID=1872480 RepID=UPI001B00AD93|nr:M23 family metallopeptidase [Altererythrobacter sp.]MBO6609525.1 M23 family metallopeptidase [Altererythrobacter sp.]MBO6642392.1 M23 family metallopeptidase [Altererythrobacter sp.]MBO6709100.1 M23 family metallopeptidase [Altererythrobacter sp.]
MIGSQILKTISRAAVLAAAGFAATAAAPALANTNAASVDIRDTVRDAQDESLLQGDVRYQQLFASWEALEENGENVGTVTAPISVPSIMPLQDAKLTSGYGMRTHPVLGGRRKHKGIDLAAPTGTPIYATADGIIDRAEWFSSYGLFVEIDHGAELETRYAHMSRLAVAEGQRVSKGDLIGYVGSTGRSTGPHLHYEVRVSGVAVNPIPYMVEAPVIQQPAELEEASEVEGGQGGE